MPWVDLPITGPAFRNTDESELDTRNAFLMDVYVNELGDTVKRPGLEPWLNLGTGSGVDGLFWWDEQTALMAVANGRLFRITNSSGAFSTYGGDLVPVGNKVSFDTTGDRLLYTNGSRIAHLTFNENPAFISDADAPALCRVVGIHDQYALGILTGQGQFRYSEVGDVLNWRPQDIATAESKPDVILNMVVTKDGVLFFGKQSVEFWINNGVAPFERVRGMTLNRGCGATYSVVAYGEEWIWMDDARLVVRASANGGVQEISQPYRKIFQDLISVEDARADIMMVEGCPLYVLTFPVASRTFVYNILQNDWSEWGYWDTNTAVYKRFKGNCFAYAKQWGFHVVGDSETGQLYKLTRSVFTDNGDIIRSVRRTGFITNGTLATKRCNRLRIRLKRGVANSSVASPTMLVRWREKAGAWSNMHPVSLGRVGEHDVVYELRQLGMYQARQWEFIHSDNTDWIIANAQADITVLAR